MRPIGYLYKRVAAWPGTALAAQVTDIYSLSGCLSEDFADYVGHWRHNGYWLFDSPRVMQELAAAESIPLDGLTLFYYEAYELEYDDRQRRWVGFEPEASFGTAVVEPGDKTLEGFDVATFCQRAAPECSPLSCNALAERLRTNEHCLLGSLQEAIDAIELGAFEDSEPGPYRVIAVYSVDGV